MSRISMQDDLALQGQYVIDSPIVAARLQEASLGEYNPTEQVLVARTESQPVVVTGGGNELAERIETRVREARGGRSGVHSFQLLLRNAPQGTLARFGAINTDDGTDITVEQTPRQATISGQSGLWVEVPSTAISINVVIGGKSTSVPWSSLTVVGDDQAAIDVGPMAGGIWTRYRTPILIGGAVVVAGVGAYLVMNRKSPRENPRSRNRRRSRRARGNP